MDEVLEEIKQLFRATYGSPVVTIEKIPQSGSDRIYFRAYGEGITSIATYGRNIR